MMHTTRIINGVRRESQEKTGLLDKFGHGTNCMLYRDSTVCTVEVVEVDVVHPEAFQRLVAGFLNVGWVSIHNSVALDAAELGGEKYLAPFSCPLEPRWAYARIYARKTRYMR